VVWGGCQPQPWHYGIISTPQVTLSLQIWGQPGRCNGIRVHLFALEPAHQRLKHFAYVYYGCLKQSEVDISLNHDVTTSFSLRKWPWVPKSRANLAGVMYRGAIICPWDSIPMAQTLFICLTWMYEWSEVDISHNHDVMASFLLHKWPWLLINSSECMKRDNIYVGTKTRKFPLPVMGMPVCILGSVRVLAFYLDPLPELY
jgi:hypothetical protein